MSYVAAVCGKGEQVNAVKEQLLQSNPVLEGENFPLPSLPSPEPLIPGLSSLVLQNHCSHLA